MNELNLNDLENVVGGLDRENLTPRELKALALYEEYCEKVTQLINEYGYDRELLIQKLAELDNEYVMKINELPDD